MNRVGGLSGAAGLVLLVWFLYLSIEVAKHVGAWPF